MGAALRLTQAPPAADVAAEAPHWRQRYPGLADRSRCECVLLLEMLKAVGADDRDPVFAALVESMVERQWTSARRRRLAARNRRLEGA